MLTRCTEILLANALPWHQRQCKGMQYMPSLESNSTQAIQWLTILADFYPLLEKLIIWFCHGFANFDRLEKRQLWLNSYHCQPAHKDDSLQASQGHYQCLGPCRGHYWRNGEASRPLKLDHHRLGVFFHLEVLVIAILFPWHQAETLYCLPPANGRPDGETE